MVDNIDITPGTGKTVATDDVGGFHYQRIKLNWGPDNTANEADIASGKPLPTQMRHSDGTIVTDATGIKISTSQLATSYTSQQAFSAGAQGVYLPSDHPALTVGAHAVTNAGTFATQASTNSAAIYDGTVSMVPKWKVIAASTSGANSIVPLVSGKKIRVLAWDLSPSAAVNAKWQSGSTDLTGLYYMAAAGNGQRASFNQVGWFETASGVVLNLNLSGAIACGGVVAYVEV